jgi:hypothetical protein
MGKIAQIMQFTRGFVKIFGVFVCIAGSERFLLQENGWEILEVKWVG